MQIISGISICICFLQFGIHFAKFLKFKFNLNEFEEAEEDEIVEKNISFYTFQSLILILIFLLILFIYFILFLNTTISILIPTLFAPFGKN